MGEVCICGSNEVYVMLVSLAQLQCGVGRRAAADVYRPADLVTYIHNQSHRAVPTFPCKLAPVIRPYRSVPVDASNISRSRKTDCYLGAGPMGLLCCRVENSFQNEITGKWSQHREPETGRSQHCEQETRKCLKFMCEDGVQ